MPIEDPKRDDGDKPSMRQRLHSATGDRQAEAQALADRAGDDVSEDDAEDAVRSAHGDTEPATDAATAVKRATSSDLASPEDAEREPPR